ncbi:MAG: hydrogenase iron-sulfur subunit [Desulfobacteraceae bacterium]|jgi:Fe-S oxidoreductase/coenzyme F420-reducing hydrogenase delta subunit
MDQFKIILYLCNWGPHAAYQELQDRGADIPAEIKMVRVPCAGRINKSLLFKPFEMGADGVLLIGCSPGSCRYGTGTENSRQNTDDTRKILGLLGIQENRLQRETFLPDEPERLLDYLKKFSHDIKAMGKSPVSKKQASSDIATPTVPEILNRYDVYACQDCGKCTSACPLALAGKSFSPRAIANSVITGDMGSPSFRENVWSCLTCGVCYERCPSAVNFPEFIRDLRQVLTAEEQGGHEVHGGFFQSLMRTMTAENLNLNRWSNVPSEIKTDPKSNVLFFGGCNPYFDTFFNRHLGVKTSNITLDSLRLLNFFDVIPAVLPNERCCGHDLLWTGDVTNFKRLAKLNTEMMQRLEITEVITACPECFRTLAHDYKQHGFELPFQVTHIYDFLEREIGKGAVKFKPFSTPVTFQDSCRMSRFEGRPDLPRTLLNRMQPENFTEMQDSGKSAICCGNSGWIGCDAYSKALQVKRLKQARAAGSEMLLTACPKCQVHLKCAMEDPFKADALDFEIRDLVSVVAEKICWE